MNALSLCSGVAGLDLGVKIAEPRTMVVAYVERDKYCQKVIQARIRDGCLDDAPIYPDLLAFRGNDYRGLVDIVTAGFPCQPFSVAGKRKGVTDERNLWPEVARVIGEIQPRVVFLENVPAILPYYYLEIRPRLSSMGFRVEEGIFSATEVGAPHNRQRLYILAYAQCAQRGTCLAQGDKPNGDDSGRQEAPSGASECSQDVPNADRTGWADVQRERSDAETYGGVKPWTGGWWDVEPAVGRVANGVADRLHRLRATGNGVVPLAAAKAFHVLCNRGRADY